MRACIGIPSPGFLRRTISGTRILRPKSHVGIRVIDYCQCDIGVIQEYFLIEMVFALYIILKASFFSPILTGFPHEAVN